MSATKTGGQNARVLYTKLSQILLTLGKLERSSDFRTYGTIKRSSKLMSTF